MSDNNARLSWWRDPFGLLAWGVENKLVNRRVLATVTLFTILISVQFLLEAFAYSWAAYFAVAELGIGLFLAVLPITIGVAAAMTAVEIKFVTHDADIESRGAGEKREHGFWTFCRRWVPVGIRGAIVFLSAFITSGPLKIGISHSEIMKELRGQIKDNAIADAEERYDGARGILPEYKRQRAETQLGMAAKFAAEEKRFQAEIDRLKKCWEAEVYQDATIGCPVSDAGTDEGKYSRKWERKSAEEEQKLSAYRTQVQQDLSAFDQATDQEFERLRRERDAEIAKIRGLSPDALVAMFAPEKAHIGYKDQSAILSRLEEKDPAVRASSDGCHLFCMLVGLFIILGKVLMTREYRRYLSLRAQAASGNEAAKAVLAAEGRNTTPEGLAMIGLQADHVQLLLNYWKSRRDLASATQKYFNNDVALYCLQDANTGLCPSISDLRRKFREEWDRGILPKVSNLKEKEDTLTEKAIALPDWSPRLPYPRDPRDIQESDMPWSMDGARLAAAYGWVDPSAKLRVIRKKLRKAREFQRDIFCLIRLGLRAFAENAIKRAEDSRVFTVDEAITLARKIDRKHILPRIVRLREIKAYLDEYGKKLPDWEYQPSWDAVISCTWWKDWQKDPSGAEDYQMPTATDGKYTDLVSEEEEPVVYEDAADNVLAVRKEVPPPVPPKDDEGSDEDLHFAPEEDVEEDVTVVPEHALAPERIRLV